ncbi:MAG: acyl-CoA synthetase [Deltaproteobacteria bacterium]|nr:acyl-CoA synthetase [Deltaproteobacteria bacterium]
MSRRKLLAIVGDAGVEPGSLGWEAAFRLGQLAVDAGFRVLCGGMRGVMEAACRGAHASPLYREGDTVGVLPVGDPDEANEWVDIVLATHLDTARNTLIANADAVVAVGGGAGTLTEIGFAWQYKRLIVGLDVPGWSQRLAGAPLDKRVRYPEIADDQVFIAATPEAAMQIVAERLPQYGVRHLGFGVAKANGQRR